MNDYVLLFEEFNDPEDLNEGLTDIIEWIKLLAKRKETLKERMASLMLKQKETTKKIASFKKKTTTAKNPISKEIYSNRSNEEMMQGQIHTVQMKIYQMKEKLLDSQLKTADLRRKKSEASKKGLM